MRTIDCERRRYRILLNEVRSSKTVVSRLSEVSRRLEVEYGKSPVFAADTDALTPERIDALVKCLLDLLLPGVFAARSVAGRGAPHSGADIGQRLQLAMEALAMSVGCAVQLSGIGESTPTRAVDEVVLEFLDDLPRVHRTLMGDVRATFEGDPAAGSLQEVVLAYPGIVAIAVHRLAHRLLLLEVPLLPRLMAEWAHRATGIDIHPAATIGRNLAIDHGTGIVIGETAVIGDDVSIYHGVTLGALSLHNKIFEDSSGQESVRRHPTIEDGVTLYANSTVLGGATVVGKGAIVGGSAFLTSSVPAGNVISANPVVSARNRTI